MAIIKTVNFNEFLYTFQGMGRKEQFSYEALQGLFEYYDTLSDDMGEPIELDVIAICCEWSEYTLEEYNKEFGQEFEDLDAWKETLDDDGIRWLQSNDETLVVSNE
jgi:hypothetical protein